MEDTREPHETTWVPDVDKYLCINRVPRPNFGSWLLKGPSQFPDKTNYTCLIITVGSNGQV